MSQATQSFLFKCDPGVLEGRVYLTSVAYVIKASTGITTAFVARDCKVNSIKHFYNCWSCHQSHLAT